MFRTHLANNQGVEGKGSIEIMRVFSHFLHLMRLFAIFALCVGLWLLSPSVIFAEGNGVQPLFLSGPDLMIEDLKLTPANPDVGQFFDITVVIKNQGDADVSSDFRVYMYVDPVAVVPTQTTPYTTRTSMFGLNAGQSFTWGRTDEVFTTEGTHHVCVWVDRDNAIVEDDESNNLICIEVHGISGRFEVVPAYALPGSPMLLMASLRDDTGKLINSQQIITASVEGNEVQLNDNGQNGDFEAGDGLYGVWCDAVGSNPLSVNLYTEGRLLLDTESVTITQQPRLLVLTDFERLYEEFLDTGMTMGEDWNTDGESDYLQLVQRVHQYAAAHQGIVGDLSHEITSARGYTENYDLLSYASKSSATNRFRMAELIDQLIYQLNVDTGRKIENIALIGDDEVVPFYRVKDPTDSVRKGGSAEREYFEEDETRLENPSFVDSSQGYILSDIPYSTRPAVNPSQIPCPSPQMGIGRIFASSPYRLIWMIDRYEQPLNLRSSESSASIFYPGKRDGDFPALVEKEGGVLQYLSGYFEKYSIYNEYSPWNANDFARQTTLNDLTFLWGHATHLNVRIQTQRYDGEIRASDLSYCEISHPSVLFGGGCHVGYTTGHYPNGKYSRYYDDALVLSLLEKGFTLFGPTSQAYFYTGTPPNLMPPNLTELLLLGVFNQLMDRTVPNVGSAWQNAFINYHAQDPYWINNHPTNRAFHTTVAYGVTMYGLPTQPLDSLAASSVQVNSISPTRRSFFMSRAIENLPEFEVSIPEFRAVQNEQGEWTYSIPQGGSQVIPPNGPPLPLIVRNYLLPYNTAVFTVTQVGTPTFDVVSGVTLANSELWTLNGDRITTTYVLPNPYPSQRYWWTVTQGNDGTLVTLSVVPLEYDPVSRTVKQFHHLEFDIDYAVAFGDDPTIDNLQINNGQTVTLNSGIIPIVIDIGSHTTVQLDLVWKARNASGFVEDSGQLRVPVTSGTTQVTFEMSPEKWEAGPLSFSFGLLQGGQLVDSENVDVLVQGPRIIMQEATSYASDILQAKWKLDIINEEGEVLEDLISKFSVSVDDEIVSFEVNEIAPGSYEIQVPLDSLPVGQHTIQIEVMDLRGIQASWQGMISRQGFIYLPFVLRESK